MGIARMRQQCISGRFFLPHKKWPGDEANTESEGKLGTELLYGLNIVRVVTPTN